MSTLLRRPAGAVRAGKASEGKLELAARLPRPVPRAGIAWTLMALLVAAGFALAPRLGPLERMGYMMAAHLVAFKLMTMPSRRRLLYLAWPGMDPRPFDGPRAPDLGGCMLVARGSAVMAVGVALWAVPCGDPVARAWLVMAGAIAFVHLGLFDVMAGLFRWNGLPVERICPEPWLSRSLAEFWGARWNRAFHAVARDHVYKPALRSLSKLLGASLDGEGGPLARRWGRTAALAAVFLFSGLVHELVISFPAGGGWGLPTLYFALHGAAVELEKRGLIRRRRITTIALVLLPLPVLFHPAFVGNCIVAAISR